MAGNLEIFQKTMNQGHSAAWERNWDHAAAFYRQALEEFPEEPKALTSLGLALFELQDYEEALSAYRKAATATPGDPLPKDKEAQICEKLGRLKEATGAALQAADLYMRSRDVDKAIENWQRVVRFSPDNMTAHSRLAITFERLGRKPEAVSEYLGIASLVQRAGDAGKAAQVINYALAILPGSNDARQALVLLKSNQALPRPRVALSPVSIPPTHQIEASKSDENLDPVIEARQKALVTLASILFDQADEKPEEVPAARRPMSMITRGTAVRAPEQSEQAVMISHLSHAVDAQTQAENDLAIKELQQAVNAGLNNLAAFYNLGMLQYNQEGYENALHNLQISVKHSDFALASRILMGGCLSKMNRLPEASIEYLEALKLADAQTVPSEQADVIIQGYEPLIDAQTRQTDPKALSTLCESISAQLLRPDWKQHLLRARQQLTQADEDRSLAPLAEVLLQTHGGQVVEALATVRSLARRDQVRSAMEEAFFALQYAPLYLPLHIQIGELLLAEELPAEATQKFMVVARLYNLRGEVAQANQLLRRVIQLNPMDLNVRTTLIEQLISQGQANEAIREYTDLADIYYRQGEFGPARQTFMQALRLAQKSTNDNKWSVQILKRMADIDLQRLDWRQALRVLEQIRTMQPDDEKTRASLIDLNIRLGQEPAALNELDSYSSYLESKRQQAHTVEFIQGIMNEHPDHISLHKRLADTYLRLKRIPEAIAELDVIGEQLLNENNVPGAVAVVQAIIKLNPPNIAEYQQLLRHLQAK
jgi:tetratricopeptide (TPR) repeat protein